MISRRDVERWFSSRHFRQKCDWVCITQPKVINDWSGPILQQMASAPCDPTDNGHVQTVDHNWITTTIGKPSHNGVIMIVERSSPASPLATHDRMVVLDGIQDPGNMGTIIRSMVAFGASALCLTRDCVDPWHPKSVDASSGTLLQLAIYDHDRWHDTLNDRSIPRFALDPDPCHPRITDIPRPSQFVLIVGSEGTGIRIDCTSPATTLVRIPMIPHAVDSLNVGVSVGIALHAFTMT